MSDLRCGRIDRHDEHDWTRARDLWRPAATYHCTGHVLMTLAEREYADRADFNDKQDDELREWWRQGMTG